LAKETAYDHLLLGVGAMKAGTTWIYDALQRNPDIHFCREKEIHYFHARYMDPTILSDRARMRRAQKYLSFDPEVSSRPVLQKRVQWTADWLERTVDDVWFNSLFKHRGDATWAAEFSNLSALLPEEAWADIHARTAKLRVIYTLRNPLDRLWSHVRFHLKMQDRTAQLDAWSLDELEDHIRTGGDYVAHNDYVGAITRMRAALPDDCLRVDVFDRIATAPRAFIADIERFVGAPPHPVPDDLVNRVVNPSPPKAMPDGLAARFAHEIDAQNSALCDLGIAVPDTWRIHHS
jgi:hypothetical protein